MDVNVIPHPFKKELDVPTSKSYANRLLILAALFPEDFYLKQVNFCDDVYYLLAALRKIGLQIETKGNDVCIQGVFPCCEKTDVEEVLLDLGEGGTTIRFLLPFLALGKNVYRLKLGEQIRKRPLNGLIEIIQNLGGHCKWQGIDLLVQGPIQVPNKPIFVDTEMTSQFASAIALTFANENVEVFAQNQKAAINYFALTQMLIHEVRAGKREFLLPVDFSSLAYPLALGAACGKVQIKNCLHLDIYQGDSLIISILEKMGLKPFFSTSGLILEGYSSFKAFEQNCQNCQDLVPVLAFLASLADDESCLSHLENLRHKETDRIKTITEILDLFSIQWRFHEQSSSLYIRRGKTVAPFVCWNSVPDHRIIMMIYLFMRYHNGGQILNADYVSKSYPHFFDSMI